MAPTVQALRAITGVYFQKIIRTIGWIIGGILLVLFVFAIILATQVSALWWLALVVLVPIAIVLGLVFGVLTFLSNRLIPRKLSTEERKELADMSSKLFGILERARTPLPITVMIIAKDVVMNRQSNIIKESIDDSRQLKTQFEKLKQSFN